MNKKPLVGLRKRAKANDDRIALVGEYIPCAEQHPELTPAGVIHWVECGEWEKEQARAEKSLTSLAEYGLDEIRLRLRYAERRSTLDSPRYYLLWCDWLEIVVRRVMKLPDNDHLAAMQTVERIKLGWNPEDGLEVYRSTIKARTPKHPKSALRAFDS